MALFNPEQHGLSERAGSSSCAPGYRGIYPVPIRSILIAFLVDDDFIVFSGSWYTPSCSLNQEAHHDLTCAWFAFLAIALVEFLIAQMRRIDRSPVPVRASYIIWIFVSLILYGYVVFQPLVSIHVVVDAAVMLTLQVFQFGALVVLNVELNIEMLSNIARLIERICTSSPTSSVSPMIAPDSDPIQKHLLDNSAKNLAVRLQHLATRLFRPVAVVYAVTQCVFLTIVPNVLGVTTTRLDLLENFLTVAWSMHAFVALTQSMMLLYASMKLRLIVHKIHLIVESLSTSSFVPNIGGVSSNKFADSIRSMKDLEGRIKSGTINALILAVVNGLVFVAAAAMGMQYWYEFFFPCVRLC